MNPTGAQRTAGRLSVGREAARNGPRSDELNLARALAAARCCEAASGTPAAQVEFGHAHGYRRVEHYRVRSAEASVFHGHSVSFICFPGTGSLGDWAANLRMVCRTGWRPFYPAGASVSRGPLAQFRDLQAWLEVELRTIEPGAEVVFAGHSLGATLAGIGAGWRLGQGRNVDQLYLFESPRFANGAFGAWVGNLTSTFVFGSLVGGKAGPVMRLPLRAWGFEHFGVPHLLSDCGLFRGLADWNNLKGPAFSRFGALRALRSYRDLVDAHSVGEIARRLAAAAIELSPEERRMARQLAQWNGECGNE